MLYSLPYFKKRFLFLRDGAEGGAVGGGREGSKDHKTPLWVSRLLMERG